MEWTIAEARQRFSQLVKDAHLEPQLITNRSRPVAAVLDAETFLKFQEWRQQCRRSLFDSLQDLGRICHEENYQLAIPDRLNRTNPFAEGLDEISS
jgi:prevent-host-death family protein